MIELPWSCLVSGFELLNRYTIAQILRGDSVVSLVRREFRKLFPDVKVDKEELAELLDDEIPKRDVIETDKAKEASSKIKRAAKKRLKKTTVKKPKMKSTEKQTSAAD